MVIEASSDHVMWVELHNVAMVMVTGAGQLVWSDKIYMDRHADSFHGDLNIVIIKQHSSAVFSLAYVRHVGPTSPLMWGMGIIQKLYCGDRLHPHHALLSNFTWGEH